MNFKSYLNENAEKLDREIGEILGDWLKEVQKTSSKLVPLAQAFIQACEGGKRLRGTLVKLGYEMTPSVRDSSLIAQNDKNKNQNDIVKVGVAYEIFHAAILTHDDVIDQSPLRRGQPTLYKALGGDHYGISQAIGLGDAGLFLSVKLIADSSFLGEYKNKALSYFAQTIINTAWGEVLDVELPHLNRERIEKDVIAIHRLKTAQYTVSGPLILGAILAGGDDHLIRALGEFGESLGIAFQIQDDILGVFGSEEKMGKSVTSDIEEGKNTLLITEALKRANLKQRKILDKYYGRGSMVGKGSEEVRKVFRDTGALDYSRQEGVEYVNQAKMVIPKISQDPEIMKLLTEMADFFVERDR